jgi:LysR family transcriptional regulator, glycine cleavage system transcriptional activator
MPRIRIPLQTLPTFVTVARLANLRAAAEALHLTHSAVSQQIKLLEEQIGFPLFERRGRRIALNAAGSAMLASVEPALAQLDDGLRAAAAASCDTEQRIRLTLLPSFAQRWLLPRMASWRERHPHIGIELHSSQQVVDLQREGFHAALRQGAGPWRGLEAERLLDSPLIAVGSPNVARRLLGKDPASFADEPLLGHAGTWEQWFALAGKRVRVNPVALAREVLVADALRAGKLYRLSPLALDDPDAYAYWLVYPPSLRDWPPLIALRRWVHEEIARSQAQVPGSTSALTPAEETAPAGRTGSRSRAPTATRARSRAR